MTSGGLLVVLAGPSGVGKGTVHRRLRQRVSDVQLSVSVTTRTPRPGERDGADYYFVDRPTFETMVAEGRLLEWAEYAGNLYGTPLGPVERAVASGRVVLLEIEVQGALQVQQRVADALLVFLVPPDWEELERRLRERGTEDDGTVERRLATARRELEAQADFDHVVVNDDLERCVEEVRLLIDDARSHAHDSARQGGPPPPDRDVGPA